MTSPSNALRDRFRASALAAVGRLREYATQLELDPRAAGVLDALRRELHRLRGSSGSYGFDDASERIGRMEQRAATWFIAPAAGVHFTVQSASDCRERMRRRERPYAVLAPAEIGLALQVPVGLPLVLLADPRQPNAVVGRSSAVITMVDLDITPDDLVVIIERLAQRTSVAGGSVVVLDDDPMILLLARAICEDAGLRVVTIEDPARLFATLNDERPGVLLMDVQFPSTSGFELTRLLRADPDWADLPVVLFSGDSSQEAREQAVAVGADGFLPKPVAPAELRAQLLARLEQVRQHRLAHGLSPASGLPEREVGLREGAQLFGALRREGGVLSAAMIRLVDPADAGRWPHACAHLARALRGEGALVAHYDDVSLVATSREGFDPILRGLEILRAEQPDDPAWVVGVAEASTVGAMQLDDLWHAAADAAAAAISGGQANRAWSPEDSTRAPDVVIVEDDEALSDLLEYALRQDGYTYQVLRTGPAALETLRAMKVGSQKPLVLLDLDLPGLDGHSIHERLRVERPRDFVVVFLSVHGGDADQVRALRAGATDYLTKPVSLRVLMAKLPRWVRQPRSGR
ncbi:MAG: response regulator [Gemmatimonadetes bacterium]|nr:response regulator [Gemmatimonadota bacterium]